MENNTPKTAEDKVAPPAASAYALVMAVLSGAFAWFYPVIYVFVAPVILFVCLIPFRLLCEKAHFQLPWVNIVLWIFSLGFPISAVLFFRRETWMTKYFWIIIPFWVLSVQPITGMTQGGFTAAISKAFSSVVRPDPGTSTEQKQ